MKAFIKKWFTLDIYGKIFLLYLVGGSMYLSIGFIEGKASMPCWYNIFATVFLGISVILFVWYGLWEYWE